jgi:hypothetical protein
MNCEDAIVCTYYYLCLFDVHIALCVVIYMFHISLQKEELDDPLAEKARLQKLVEESDHAIAGDLFAGVGATKLKEMKKADEDVYTAALSGLAISNAADSELFAAAIAKLVTPYRPLFRRLCVLFFCDDANCTYLKHTFCECFFFRGIF